MVSNKDAVLICFFFFEEVELCKRNCEHNYEHKTVDKHYKTNPNGFSFDDHIY